MQSSSSLKGLRSQNPGVRRRWVKCSMGHISHMSPIEPIAVAWRRRIPFSASTHGDLVPQRANTPTVLLAPGFWLLAPQTP